MSRTRYAFKGYKQNDKHVDAQAIGECLDALIDEKNEHVTPEEIVAAARDKQSPLHGLFTWPENEAADKWRRKEAKNVTNTLHLAKEGKPSKTRAFVYIHHPEHDGKKVLLSTRSAMARPEMREQVIEQAVKALKRSLTFWASAYGGNAELRSLAKDVKALQRRVEREMMATI